MNKNILIIEDSDAKWREIDGLIHSTIKTKLTTLRASTMEIAKQEIEKGPWDLILLDISMDIRASNTGPRAGGHDATGGLKIAERMFYLRHEAPVIIVTAFDAFPSDEKRQGTMLGIQDITREASRLLGDWLVGWVRYGDPEWAQNLSEKIREVILK